MQIKIVLIVVLFLLGCFKVLTQDSSQIHQGNEIDNFNSVPKQDSLKLIILSPRVGEIIDESEREKFGLFKTFKRFKSAILFEKVDYGYFGYILFPDEKGMIKDTLIKYNGAYLMRVSQLINNYERVMSGDYKFGNNLDSLIIVEDKNNLLSNIVFLYKNNKELKIEKTAYKQIEFQSAKDNDLLKFSNVKIDIVSRDYPRFNFGFGLRSPYSTNDLNGVLIDRQNQISSNTGFEVSSKQIVQLTPISYTIKIGADLSKEISVLFELGTNFGNSNEVDLKSVSLIALYHFNFFKVDWFNPFIGAGISNYQLSLNQNIEYNNRITENDSLGYYYYLQSIDFNNKSSSFGYNFISGFEFRTTSVLFNFSANYHLIKVFHVSSYEKDLFYGPLNFSLPSKTYKINFSGIDFGFNIAIFFN